MVQKEALERNRRKEMKGRRKRPKEKESRKRIIWLMEAQDVHSERSLRGTSVSILIGILKLTLTYDAKKMEGERLKRDNAEIIS